MGQTRYEKGIDTLKIITGLSKNALIDSLSDLPSELSDWIIEFAYGDVLSRRQLDLKTRQLATVAALTAMGTASPQLKAHIKGALNAGCKQAEILEVILQMAVYAGFPAALNAIGISKEVFDNENNI
jgi:4-carboxymuconolactone decarboxylase